MNSKKQKPDIIGRVHAARCWIDGHRDRNGKAPEGMEMAAFMAIFHPEITGKRLKNLLKKD